MSAKWPKVRLGEVLKPVSRSESVDLTREYRLLGIRLNGQGPFIREKVLGSQSAATKLFQVAEGDFVYSRLFACRGAFGVISHELKGCYVSGEFPVFLPNHDKIDIEFLRLWFRLPSVIALVDEDCSGSTPLTRNRFKEHFFLALEIPLPPLPEQRRIVARIEELAAQINEAKRLRRLAVEEADALLQAARRRVFGENVQSNWFPLSRYVAEIENGKSPATDGRPAALDEWAVLKVGAVSFGVFDQRENKALPASFTPITRYEVRQGDFLMNRANTAELVGACVVVRNTRSKLMLSDKIFRFIFHEPRQVDLSFLDQVLKSSVLRSQIVSAASGSSPTMKNISKAKVFALRLPPYTLPEQHRIVAYLDELQAQVDALKCIQAETATELEALLPSILDKAFRGEL